MKTATPAIFSVRDSYLQGDSYRLTGVLSAEGVAPHAAEVKVGLHDRWHHSATTELPAMLDATNPSNFTVLWADVPQVTQQQIARRVAEQAAAAANGAPVSPSQTAGMTGPEQVAFGVAMRGFGGMGGGMGGGGGVTGVRSIIDGLMGGGGPATTRVTSRVTVNGVPVDPQVADGGMAGLLGQLGVGLGGPSASAGGPLPEAALRAGVGEPATATILAAHPVPEDQWPAGPRPPAGYISFALDVTGPDGSSWPATCTVGFRTPERRDEVAVVGATVPVRFDPANRPTVGIDLDRLPPVV